MSLSGAAARRALRLASFALVGVAGNGQALAHAFGARYELPVPVWLFIVGGALTVTLTFIVLAAFARGSAERYAGAGWQLLRAGIHGGKQNDEAAQRPAGGQNFVYHNKDGWSFRQSCDSAW